MPVLDTNVIVRYLTQDNDDHSPRAYAFLQRLEDGREVATLPEGVLVEVVQVLSSKNLYQLPRATIRSRLQTVVALRGIRLQHKQRYLRALDLYAAHAPLSFVDALCVAHAESEREPTVISFDRGFDRILGLIRREP